MLQYKKINEHNKVDTNGGQGGVKYRALGHTNAWGVGNHFGCT